MTVHDRDGRLIGRDVQGDLVCTQCARVAGSVQGQNTRHPRTVVLRVTDPVHTAVVRRLRCPHCSGRLWLQNSAEIPLDPLAFDREALQPKRGRPPKMSKGG